MMGSASDQVSVLLDLEHITGLEAQVAATVPDARRRPRVLEHLLARDGLIAVLEATTETEETRWEIDVRGGVIYPYRLREILGWLDLAINGHRVGVYPVAAGADTLWLDRARVEAQAAPQVWVVVALRRRGTGLRATLLGWATQDILRGYPVQADGLREIPRTALEPPARLLAFLHTPPRTRAVQIRPDRAIRAQLEAALGLDRSSEGLGIELGRGTHRLPIWPLSQVGPEVVDCLVADAALADAYLAALAAAPQARVHVSVSTDWTLAPLPQSPVAGSLPATIASSAVAGQEPFASPPLTGLAPQVWARVRERQFGPALELLQDATEPYALTLRAMVQSLRGNLRLAVADAKRAYQAVPDQAFGLFEPISHPEFALAWQYAPPAGLTVSQVEVIDAREPATEPPCEKETAELRWEDEHLIFSLGVQLDASYEGFAYRVFVVDEELRHRLHLADHGGFRQAFAWRPQQPPTEEQYVLVVQAAVLTEAGGLLEGNVPTNGMIDIWEPIMVSGRAPAEFFVNKHIVVLLYPSWQTDGSG